MLGTCDIVAFVMTGDAARAKAFYGETLGLPLGKQDPFATVFNANGIVLRITEMPGHAPTEHPVLGWNVPDIAATVAGLGQAGVTFERYPFLEQDEAGIWTSPDGMAKIAFFKDPDGNVLSIAQS